MSTQQSTADPRADARRRWLDGYFGDSAYALEAASEDASFRRYFRVVRGANSLILMDAPPEHEDSSPFVRVAGLLTDAGINAPRVVAGDLQRGFLLLSDLGSTRYLDALNEDSADRLYRAAIGTLVAMQSRIDAAALPAYDERLLRAEMALFRDWLLDRHLGLPIDAALSGLLERCFDVLVANALEQPQVFVHRDYHSRNLMVTGSTTPGVLDFQDAVRGPATYDPVSLLKDCYVKWSASAVNEWFGAYVGEAQSQGLLQGVGEARLQRWFVLMGIQRQLKASGIFARLCHRDGKGAFLNDVPRTLSYIVDAAPAYPELAELGELVEERVLRRWTR